VHDGGRRPSHGGGTGIGGGAHVPSAPPHAVRSFVPTGTHRPYVYALKKGRRKGIAASRRSKTSGEPLRLLAPPVYRASTAILRLPAPWPCTPCPGEPGREGTAAGRPANDVRSSEGLAGATRCCPAIGARPLARAARADMVAAAATDGKQS
jgi:hypothetical protein